MKEFTETSSSSFSEKNPVVGGPPQNRTRNRVSNKNNCFATTGRTNGTNREQVNIDFDPNISDKLSRKPYTCLINLIEKYPSFTNKIPDDIAKEAFDSYKNTTGVDRATVIKNLLSAFNNDTSKLTIVNTIFIFIPLALMLLIVIWVLFASNALSLGVSLFLSVFILLIIYTFCVVYRLIIYNNLTTSIDFSNYVDQLNESERNNVLYFAQGLLTAACKISDIESGRDQTTNLNVNDLGVPVIQENINILDNFDIPIIED